MMHPTARLSLREAAQRAGVSKDTVWRAVQRGELAATTVIGTRGKQFLIEQTAFEAWYFQRRGESIVPAASACDASDRSDSQNATLQTSKIDAQQPTNIRSDDDAALPSNTRSNSVASDRPEATLRTVIYDSSDDVNATLRTQAVDQTRVDSPPAVPLEAHLTALRLLDEERRRTEVAQLKAGEVQQEVRSLERQAVALQFELGKYRLALEENAASLAEREARAQEAEAKAKEAVGALVKVKQAEMEVQAERERRLQAEVETARAQVAVRQEVEERERIQGELADARRRVEEFEAAEAARRQRPWWRRLLSS